MYFTINSSLFFLLFYLPIALFFMYVINDKFERKDKLMNDKLIETLNDIFKRFDKKKYKLSEKEFEEYQILKKIQNNYINMIDKLSTKALVFYFLFLLLFKKNRIKENQNSNVKMNKRSKELEALRIEVLSLLVVGVLIHNKLFNKMYLLARKIDLTILETSELNGKNEFKTSLEDDIKKMEKFSLKKINKVAFGMF